MRGSRRFSAIACFSIGVLASGCRTGGTRDEGGEGSFSAPSSPPAPMGLPEADFDGRPAKGAIAVGVAEPSDRYPEAATNPSDVAPIDATPATQGSRDDPYLDGRPVAARSIGHTSYVLKVRLDSGLAGAYKPRSTLPLGCCRYKGEIAAYRLARALGLNNVPYAMPRAFFAPELRAALGSRDLADDFDRKVLVDPDGRVRGALIPWIDHYDVLALEQPEWRARWERWLTDPTSSVAESDRTLARAISILLGFDYLSANWDRWSGGNVAVDGATTTVLFVDNDGAFYEAPPQAALSRQVALLKRVVRYSRTFVASLRTLDAAALRDAFGRDERGEPLLSARVIEDVDARRKALLEIIAAQASKLGEDRLLAFE